MRKLLKALFWNETQCRLRMVWRLVLQVLVMLAAGVLFTILLNLAALIPSLVNTLSSEQGQNAVALEQAITALMNSRLMSAITIFISTCTVLTAVLLAGRWLDRRKIADFGFHFDRQWWVDLSFGFGLGGVLMGLIFLLEVSAGWVKVTDYWQTPGNPFLLELGVAFFVFICVGIYEELLFRAYYLRNIAEGFNLRWIGPRWALVIAFILTSAIFGVGHLTNPNASWLSTFNIFLAGLFLGSGYLLTGEMAIPIGLHIGWNFFQGNVFGFPVSGTYAGASIFAIQQQGLDLLTGGKFGPEAGLVGVGAILIGCTAVYVWVRATRSSASLQQRLAMYRRKPGKMPLDNPLEMSIIKQNITLKDVDEGK